MSWVCSSNYIEYYTLYKKHFVCNQLVLSKLGIRKVNMEKVPLKAPHVTNDLDQAILKLIQVTNLGEE
jgi:hypothetical protein